MEGGNHLFENDAVVGQGNGEKTEKKFSEEEKKSMREAAQEIPTEYLDGFTDAIGRLLLAKQEGKNCFVIFDGKPYYSVDINTRDDAYLQRDGVSEADFRDNIDRL